MRFAPEAADHILKLHPEVKQEIREAIWTLQEALLTGHHLQQELPGFRSYCVRVCRIMYRLNDEDRTIDVVFVGPRRNVYEELFSLVRQQSFRK